MLVSVYNLSCLCVDAETRAAAEAQRIAAEKAAEIEKQQQEQQQQQQQPVAGNTAEE